LLHVLWEWSASSPKAETVSTQQEAVTSQQHEAITWQTPEPVTPSLDYRADALAAKTLFAADVMASNKKWKEKEVSDLWFFFTNVINLELYPANNNTGSCIGNNVLYIYTQTEHNL
jgi:hypothetical protein